MERKIDRQNLNNEDKYLLFKGLAEIRFREVYYIKLPNKLRKKYINEGIKYSQEALKINSDSVEVNFYLGVFYYKNSKPKDIEAKKQFLKVIDLDSENTDAYIALSELYYRNGNKSRAGFYADKALKIDPVNERAKFMQNFSKE